ncbi:hypothetical protein ABK040_013168 [Willaertia magna]
MSTTTSTDSSSFFSTLFPNSHPQLQVMANGHKNMLMYFTIPQSFEPWVKYILFEQWNADNNWKYALSLIGIFLIAFLNQFIHFLLHIQISYHKHKYLYYIINYVFKPLGFLFEMTVGYLLMLIAMNFNFGLLMGVVGGNTIGYIIFQLICMNMLDSYYHPNNQHANEDDFDHYGGDGAIVEKSHHCCKKKGNEGNNNNKGSGTVVNYFDASHENEEEDEVVTKYNHRSSTTTHRQMNIQQKDNERTSLIGNYNNEQEDKDYNHYW